MFSAAIKASAGAAVKDPQFNYVTMLLHGDGSASGNTIATSFISDASTNNFGVAINGDTRSDNFTPYQGNGYYSNYFNGSTDYITAPSNCGALGTNDFTIEMWYRSSGNNGTYARAVSQGIVGTATTGAWGLGVYRAANEFYWSTYYSGSFNDIQTGINLNDGVWHHIAATRVGTTLKLYSDGVLRATGTIPSAMNFGSTSDPLMVAYQNRDNNYVNGNISNLRIIIGSALYTGSTYTVPTTPLTAVSGTVLLTSQSNRFIDNSTNAYTITKYGSASVTPAQPFSLPTTSATYGSGYFDGSGDYLTMPSAIPFAANNFTIEGWFYATSLATTKNYWGQDNGGGSNPKFILYIDASGNLNLDAGNISGTVINVAGSNLKLNAWQHIAVVRGGTGAGQTAMFIDGVRVGTGTLANLSSITSAFNIGYIGEAYGSTFSGYISNFRVVNGTDVYGYTNTTITIPTSPLTAVTNTYLLTNQYNGGATNSGFKDSSQNIFPITRNGNTTQGTFTPYGSNWSNYIGVGNYLTTTATTGFNISGNFTIECWLFMTDTGNNTFLSVGTPRANFWYAMGVDPTTNTLSFSVNTPGNWNISNTYTTTSSVPLARWTHIAAVKNGTNFSMYINGVSGYSTNSFAQPTGGSGTVYVGTYFANTNNDASFFRGYMSNFRLVNGTAVYTSAFTPPIAPLTAITNTQLLTCQSNRFVDNSSNNGAIGLTGSPSVQRFSPFITTLPYSSTTIGGSAYFDGSGDSLTLANNAAFNLGANNFTIEAWVYVTATPGGSGAVIVGKNSATYPGGYEFNLVVDTGRTIFFGAYTSTLVSLQGTIVTSLNAWNHVAAVRSGSNWALFVNGVRDVTATSSGTVQTTSSSVYVGDYGGGGRNLTGYSSNIRLVNGSAVYNPTVSTLTVPTAPLTAITNTSLLLSNTNAGIFDNAMMNDLETVGNAQVSTSVKKFGNGSMYFDGSGDYLLASDSPNTEFGSGDFTVECWAYYSSTSGTPVLIDKRANTGGYSPFIFYTTGGTLLFYSSSNGSSYDIANGVTIGSVTTGTWYHVAASRSGSSIRLFLNGTLANTITSSASLVNNSDAWSIGGTVGGNYLNGYIDDLRITKGYARYTANFTPPTAAFPNN